MNFNSKEEQSIFIIKMRLLIRFEGSVSFYIFKLEIPPLTGVRKSFPSRKKIDCLSILIAYDLIFDARIIILFRDNQRSSPCR